MYVFYIFVFEIYVFLFRRLWVPFPEKTRNKSDPLISYNSNISHSIERAGDGETKIVRHWPLSFSLSEQAAAANYHIMWLYGITRKSSYATKTIQTNEISADSRAYTTIQYHFILKVLLISDIIRMCQFASDLCECACCDANGRQPFKHNDFSIVQVVRWLNQDVFPLINY